MADIALVFHWGPEQMNAMPLDELMDWRDRACERWERTHGAAGSKP